ncbi:MAG: U32 family peptidase [Clostridia bacterium]|nr:U32 family peptidase [Clostridia bacterium]
MKIPELLAPAGSIEKAKIAFMYGADAVYAGTAKLSLRSRAELNIDTLSETIEYAHSIGKRVYVALNIYAHDENYADIESEVKRLKEIGADAIIASDVGVIAKIKEIAPDMQIHISTQANTVSLESAKFWHQYGAKRIILARELSKEKIQYIMENKPKDLEIEMFIHGAICFAYSGRCYLSKYLANRCANLGDCAQSCRWQYNITASEVNHPDSVMNIDFDEKGTYLFSSKDMCLIHQIPTIVDMGVDSLKIEGRLKTDYYLATVVRVYRQAINEYVTLKQKGNEKEFDASKYLNELLKVKTRGLSEFYFSNDSNQDIHDLDGKNENPEYEYGAKIISEYDKLGKNIYIVEIKNKLSVGDELEILYPNNLDLNTFTIEKLYNEKTNEKIETINPGIKGQLVKIYIPYDNLCKDLIIRRKK